MWDEIPNVLKDYDGPCKPWEWCKPHFDEAAKQNLDIITQTQYVDMVSYMPFDICLKADKMSMSQSLELRVPFLDKKVLDVALQLPTACRVDDDHAKYALRVAASKLGFQKKVANMPKQPFITPLTVWLQTDLYYDLSLIHISLKALEGDKEWQEKVWELMDAVDSYIPTPERMVDKPFLMAVEDTMTITGRGTVATGRVERGTLHVNDPLEIVGIKETQNTVSYTHLDVYKRQIHFTVSSLPHGSEPSVPNIQQRATVSYMMLRLALPNTMTLSGSSSSMQAMNSLASGRPNPTP